MHTVLAGFPGSSTESNNVLAHKAEEKDRLTMLTDDVLLHILGRVDLATAARTSTLSKHWRNLPWLLPELNLHVTDFLCPDDQVELAQQMDQAMASLTKATKSFLAQPHLTYDTVARLSLKLYMTGNYNYKYDIGLLVSDAIDNGMVKELDLAILDKKEYCKIKDKLQRARDVEGFFSEYPSMIRCLARLHLQNVCFAEWEISHLLFDCCKQLQHLSLDNCDAGKWSIWQINAPNSNIRILEFRVTWMKRLEVLCLPKLERLHFKNWLYHEPPLSFGSVSSLKELLLLCPATIDHRDFSLSQVLCGATNLHTLTLNFQGEKLWIQPEGKQLCTAFNMLKKLCIHGIYVEFDLLWTINLLEAATSVEIFDVEIYEHQCQEGERRVRYYGAQREKPSWKASGFTVCNNRRLKELRFAGFRPLLESHMLFVRAMMDHAPHLETVLLTDGEASCENCDAVVPRPPRTGGLFPRDRAEQETVARQLRSRACAAAKIVFSTRYSTVVL
ncbi:uncharacterized protein LOC124661533 [Lolium rigidum]|uniref:uncharacterized protein LOC124661533 n=1 Tax=Lolium rigidum TaxID=89674 RepID=UPI001F5D4C66|nr:uncharacterized protein LOC124661533 [Lolium rigidum]